MEEDRVIEDIGNIEQFVEEELPEGEPRYVAYTFAPLPLILCYLFSSYPSCRTEYETKDGRKTYPLVFIYFSPPTSIAMNTLYASTKQRLINALQILKVFCFSFTSCYFLGFLFDSFRAWIDGI